MIFLGFAKRALERSCERFLRRPTDGGLLSEDLIEQLTGRFIQYELL